jgi:NAD(P)-dependent dehydrogenase (short-subunit alcohol dehydrogenase family)
METVLVVGATGNIGVSAVKAALHSGRHVLAVVRNQDSAKKMFQHVGTQEGISTVEADILSEHGIKSVVEKVESGQLPAFQHVYGAGAYFWWMSFSFGSPFWLKRRLFSWRVICGHAITRAQHQGATSSYAGQFRVEFL